MSFFVSPRRNAGATPQDPFSDDNVVDLMPYLQRRAASAIMPGGQEAVVIPLAFGRVLRRYRLMAGQPTDPTTPSPATAAAKATA